MGWSRFPQIQELFFHSSDSKPIYDKPQKTGRLFPENMNVDPQMRPITWQNPKIVIFGDYSLLGFSE